MYELSPECFILKGSVSNFFAPAAAEAALRLEMAGQSGNLAGAGEHLASLEQAIESVRTVLGRIAEEANPEPLSEKRELPK